MLVHWFIGDIAFLTWLIFLISYAFSSNSKKVRAFLSLIFFLQLILLDHFECKCADIWKRVPVLMCWMHSFPNTKYHFFISYDFFSNTNRPRDSGRRPLSTNTRAWSVKLPSSSHRIRTRTTKIRFKYCAVVYDSFLLSINGRPGVATTASQTHKWWCGTVANTYNLTYNLTNKHQQ